MPTIPTRPRLYSHHGHRTWTSTWYDDAGGRRTKRFGVEGELNARQARARYDFWIESEWRRYEHVRNPGSAPAVYTVDRLREDFLAYARVTYRKGGEETSHVLNIDYALAALVNHHTGLPADALTNPQLAKLRDAMIHKENGNARSIKTVNGRLHAIQQAYKWAREKGYVSAVTLSDLTAVSRLRRGRSEAKDPVQIRPIDWSVVETTIDHCPPTLAAMIQVNWLTGMRPGEVCVMRPCDIETGGKVWLYRPSRHKLEHKAIDRPVYLGPLAQDIIRPYLTRTLAAFMFTPGEAQSQRLTARHAARKTPPTYGNTPGSNRVESPAHPPGEMYDGESYRKAIHHACRKAGIATWNPNQLRHSYATRIRKDFGVENASIGLGHGSLNTTLIYAEASGEKAAELALKIG